MCGRPPSGSVSSARDIGRALGLPDYTQPPPPPASAVVTATAGPAKAAAATADPTAAAKPVAGAAVAPVDPSLAPSTGGNLNKLLGE